MFSGRHVPFGKRIGYDALQFCGIRTPQKERARDSQSQALSITWCSIPLSQGIGRDYLVGGVTADEKYDADKMIVPEKFSAVARPVTFLTEYCPFAMFRSISAAICAVFVYALTSRAAGRQARLGILTKYVGNQPSRGRA